MTTQAEQLIGARVTDGEGQVAGTVQQVFNDETDGRPAWVRVRAGKRDHFVPLGGSRATGDGLSVPFGTQQIMSAPAVNVDRRMSAAQTDQLRRHFGLAGPAPAGRRDASSPPGEEWLIRAEERVDVGTERQESGRARLHKYVDVEPVEQTVRVVHEEYEVERVPITPEEQLRGVIAAGEQELILHEERPVFRKETVPVERVRLVLKQVEADRTLRDEIRKERVEVETDDGRRPTRPADQAAPDRRRR